MRPARYRKLLAESIDWLKARGVSAEGYLASGDYIDQIIAFSNRLNIDLIVLGHYPRPSGGSWWSASKRVVVGGQSQMLRLCCRQRRGRAWLCAKMRHDVR